MATGLEGTLTGTLPKTPEEVLAAMEALRAVQANALALQRKQATNAAGQAAEQYAGLAQAPPPDIAPWAQLLNTLQGNVSSILSGNQGFQERAQERTQMSRAMLLKRRAETMQAQRDVWQQRAEEAKRLGNLEEQEKYNSKMLMLDKQFDLVSANQKRAQVVEDREAQHKDRLAEVAAQGVQQRLTNAATRGGLGGVVGESDEVQAMIDDLAEGRAELTQVPAKFRASVQAGLRAQGKRIMPKKVREAINEVSAAEGVVDEIANISAEVNKARANFAARGAQGLKSLGEILNQSGLAADLETARGGLAGNLARAVAAERGVLTNQDRIYAMRLVPTIWDPEARAKRKIAMLRRFIQRKRQSALSAYTKEGAGVAAPATNGATAPAGDPLGIR